MYSDQQHYSDQNVNVANGVPYSFSSLPSCYSAPQVALHSGSSGFSNSDGAVQASGRYFVTPTPVAVPNNGVSCMPSVTFASLQPQSSRVQHAAAASRQDAQSGNTASGSNAAVEKRTRKSKKGDGKNKTGT